MYITPAYAAVAMLLFIWLSVRTLRLRRKLGIAVGDQGSPEMLRAMRVHANFAEYVPITFLATLMLELQGAPDALVHWLCALLVTGRVSHALGVSRAAEDYRYRVLGLALTLSALGVAAVALLIGYVLLFFRA